MENDSVRTSGETTLLDMWIAGKLRSISVSRAAVEAWLQLPPGRSTTDDERREFVRTHLGEVVTVATQKLERTDPAAGAISIDAADLQAPGGGASPSAARAATGARAETAARPIAAARAASGERAQRRALVDLRQRRILVERRRARQRPLERRRAFAPRVAGRLLAGGERPEQVDEENREPDHGDHVAEVATVFHSVNAGV